LIDRSAPDHRAAAAGNLLASVAVPGHLVEAWHRSPGRRAEARLLEAFRAAMAVGGEAGPDHSAGLSVVAGYGWRVTDLRVDWSDDPALTRDKPERSGHPLGGVGVGSGDAPPGAAEVDLQ
jgi:uncharacterized Ntn-hydrolase superfamily protein